MSLNNLPQLNPLQEGLRLMNQCPVCKKQYKAGQANILEQKGGTQLVHITCPHCQNAILAVVVISQIGMSSVGMITDLNAGDVLRCRNKEAVNEEEVLDFHQLLKDNQIFRNGEIESRRFDWNPDFKSGKLGN